VSTIKDVAKLAGVSHGTASNVLNGYKSVNSDIVKRVEEAVKELGYQPNLKARSMRNSRTNCIGVLLPNITDNIYIRIYNGVERTASEAGYSISLYISNGSPETEEKLLLRIQQQRMDGAVIVTCMPDKTDIFNQLLKSGTRLVFVRRKPVNMQGKTFLGIDERQAIFDAVSTLLKRGCGEIALLTGREEYSNEQDCIRGFQEAFTVLGAGKGIVKSAADGKENAFRAAARLLGESKPQAIITTCPEHAKGVQAAVRMFSPDNRIFVLALDNGSWINAVSSVPWQIPVISIVQRYIQLGEEAAKKLLKMVTAPDTGVPAAKSTILPAQPVLPASLPYSEENRLPARANGQPPQNPAVSARRQGPAARSGRVLRVLMLENTSSDAAQLMKSIFTAETSVPVEIDTLPYEAMYDATIGEGGRESYDILQINIPWINEAIRRDIIVPLDDLAREDGVIRGAFSPEILERHGLFEGTLYTVPFMVGTQLFFYRKDLFGDLRIRRLYFEKNKTALEVPVSWRDYDQIAEFFTQKYNPESPVPYGTTMGGLSGFYCWVLRLWEVGISLFRGNHDEGSPAAGSLSGPGFVKRVEDTLVRYVRAFDFADPDAKNWNQAEQANQFCRGNSAMMVLYQAHFADHIYRHGSNVSRENIGFAPLPGRTSILGGWSLGIRAGSVMREEARRFLEWICRDANSIPYNILGGSIPGNTAFNSFEMRETYPWLSPSFDGVQDTRSMIDNGVHWISQWEFECLAEGILNRLLHGRLDVKTATEELLEKLADIKKRDSYTGR
jgi:DNA-binding LacI/PurR family transcriptional regulator/ABC-type glycerol-3-phosphate transport system substrate-binding protein